MARGRVRAPSSQRMCLKIRSWLACPRAPSRSWKERRKRKDNVIASRTGGRVVPSDTALVAVQVQRGTYRDQNEEVISNATKRLCRHGATATLRRKERLPS